MGADGRIGPHAGRPGELRRVGVQSKRAGTVQRTTIDSLIPYVTSAEADLAAYSELTPADGIVIPGRSIVTLVGYDSEHFFCGDGACNVDENCKSCPSDCKRRGWGRSHKGGPPRPPNVCPGP